MYMYMLLLYKHNHMSVVLPFPNSVYQGFMRDTHGYSPLHVHVYARYVLKLCV